MRLAIVAAVLSATLCSALSLSAQTRRPAAAGVAKQKAVVRSSEVGQSATVMDETLSVLRLKPSLYSDAVQRMRRGRRVQILAVTEADGVKFYRVTAPPNNSGWVQSDAVFGKFRPGDEERLVKLIQAIDGFDQIEMASEFFTLFPQSKFRPSILLLYGDLLEEVAAKLSKEANSRLIRKEMAASAAPMHSYYLNYVALDRYRKLGIDFVFNSNTRAFHYDGASWEQVVSRFGQSAEATESARRLETLKAKMATPAK